MVAKAASAIGSAWMLCQRAAWTGAARDIEMALSHSLAAAHETTYDSHQFHGAIGLTLEHPLHFFTFRIAVLRNEVA